MGQKCFKGGEDTPWVTFNCNMMQIRESNNIAMDFTDGGEDNDVKVRNCCCIQWRRRVVKKDREMKKGMEEIKDKRVPTERRPKGEQLNW
ncbi:Hypothetical predicted protein [Paramuricea clavata]|uniref:Uncharacterized protein n=1 Tax=Paramuricea clavata TaxID=317549 RepID=A0A6S7FEX5_PARCT|nr:Hypothetical predicted protein [Paramuricea clavata]